MTEKKRYTYLNASRSSFTGSFFCNDIPLTNQEVVELLEENEQLSDFKSKTFNSIDGKIKRGEQAIEWGERIGADVGAMGFHIELLKQLKKELFE